MKSVYPTPVGTNAADFTTKFNQYVTDYRRVKSTNLKDYMLAGRGTDKAFITEKG